MKNTQPNRQPPAEPKRAYKFVSYTGQLLDAGFRGGSISGRRRGTERTVMPVRLFFKQMQQELDRLSINLDHVVAERLSPYSFAIGHRVFVESEDDYLKRYELYEARLKEYNSQTRAGGTSRPAPSKLVKLQMERDKLKSKLADINAKIDGVSGTA